MTASFGKRLLLFAVILPISLLSQSVQAPSAGHNGISSVVQANLTAPGGIPFHLKATITEKGDPDFRAKIEIFWAAPDKWRRIIQSPEFSQKLIVTGDKIFEEDAGDYFPVGLQTLATAMVNPGSVLDALRPGDSQMTKANGASKESGEVCYAANHTMCVQTRHGLMEIVLAPGRSVDFIDYQDFKGRRVARLLIYHIDHGDSLKAEVTELKELTDPVPKLFAVAQPTARERQIRTVVLPEAELRGVSLEAPEIIWPQVLDGATNGPASYYVSVDRSGRVRETLPLNSANERANDSARRQIMKWKFKPVVKDGVPVQAEAILSFELNTRAWGPPSPLTDAEVRKLVSNAVEPVIPAGTAPVGAIYTLRAAIDHEGNLIEVIGGGGPPKLFGPCYDAIKKWHFKPFMQDGLPRPYRAEIIFQVR